LPQLLSEAIDALADLEERIGRDRLGRLASDIARVRREDALGSARRLMEAHARSRRTLEIQFEGESGFGSGVSQNFYSSVANELLLDVPAPSPPVPPAQSADADATRVDGAAVRALGATATPQRQRSELPPMWLDGGTSADDTAGTRAGAAAGGAGGLYPRPLQPAALSDEVRTGVAANFRSLGQLMAKACLDRFIVPLPLSAAFFGAVRGDQLGLWALPPVGATGEIVAAYAALCMQAAATGSSDASFAGVEPPALASPDPSTEFARQFLRAGYEMSISELLESLGDAATFVCPVTGESASHTRSPRLSPVTCAVIGSLVRWAGAHLLLRRSIAAGCVE
jgi:hypothetical protein